MLATIFVIGAAAVDTGAQCIQPGDVNGDGVLSTTDIHALVASIHGTPAACPQVDLRPGVDAGDLAHLLALLTGNACTTGLTRLCPLQEGVCFGATTSCDDGLWAPCDYGPLWEPVEVSLDGLDNDCDGDVDIDCPGGRATQIWCDDGLAATTMGVPSLEDTWAVCGGDLSEYDGGEAVYRFGATEDTMVRLNLSSDAELDMLLLGEACDFTSANCRGVVATPGGIEQAMVSVAAGERLWIVVDGLNASGGDFDLELSCPQCSGGVLAEPVECGDTLRGTTMGIEDVESMWAICGGTAPNLDGGEGVFAFVAEGDGEVRVELQGDHPDAADLDVFVLGGECDFATATCLAVGNADNGLESVRATVTAGEAVWVVVDGRDGAEDDFSLSLSCPDCLAGVTATALTCGASVSGTTVGNPDTESTWAVCGGSEAELTGGEAFYRFEPAVDGSVQVVLSPDGLGEHDLVLLALGESCLPSGAQCLGIANAIGGEQVLDLEVVKGEPIWLVVDGRDGAAADFVLSARCLDCPGGLPIQPVVCGDAVEGSTLGETDRVDGWTACGGAAGAHPGGEAAYRLVPATAGEVRFSLTGEHPDTQDLDLFVLRGLCEETAANCAGLGATVGGIEAVTVAASFDEPLYVVVDGHDGAEDDFVLGVSCPDCTGGLESTPVSCGETLSGTTIGATDNEAMWPSCGGYSEDHTGGEAVYRYVSPTAGLLTIELEASTPETEDLDVFVFTGSCDFETGDCLGSATSIGGLELLEVPVEEGQELWIVVDGYDGAADLFTLRTMCAMRSPETEAEQE